jgi:excisionase family DNA binding protein
MREPRRGTVAGATADTLPNTGAVPMSGTPAHLYTSGEAAEMLHISEEWLRKQVQRKLVRHTRLGRRVRFTDEQIIAIVAERETPIVQPKSSARTRL